MENDQVSLISKFPGIIYQSKIMKKWKNILVLEALNINSPSYGILYKYTKEQILPVVTRFIMMWLEIKSFNGKLF